MSGLIGVCAIMAMVNALTGDWHGAAAFAYVATGMTVVRWAVLRVDAWRKRRDSLFAHAADRSAAPHGSSAGAPHGPERSEELPREPFQTNSENIRAMRLRLRRLGRDDGAFSDSDVLGLINAVDAFLAHGELCRVALGDGRQIEITWRTQIVTTDHNAGGNGR